MTSWTEKMFRFQDAAFGYLMLLTVIAMIDWAMPVSYWVVIDGVEVQERVCVGETANMTVKRYVRNDYIADWRVELEEIVGEGRRVFVDVARGTNTVQTANIYPFDLTLDWWTYPVQFRPKPGKYLIETCWTLQPVLLFSHRMCQYSNQFEYVDCSQ